MKKRSPFVSIIVVNYNGKRFLKRCFDSLYNLNYPRSKVEIIMVDNCSQDDSIDYVRKYYPRIKIIKNNVNNYCRANNLGIKKSKGKYIALINNDIKATDDWLIEAVKVIDEDNSVGAVGSKILFMDGRIQSVGHQEHPNFYWVDRGFREPDRGQYSQIVEAPSLCGCSVLYRKKCLKDVGLLDEDLNIYLEDVDMSIRCRKKGWKLLICPKSVIYHELHGTAGDESTALSHQERNRLLLIAKHWPDKLPEAIVGREYFTKNLDYAKEKDICNVIAFVYSKLMVMHGMKVVNSVSPRLFAALRKIFNSERDFFVQTVNVEQEQTKILTDDLENAHREADSKKTELQIVKQQLEETKEIDKQRQEKMAQLEQDIGRRTEQTKILTDDLENAHREANERENACQRLQQTIQQQNCLLMEHKKQIEQKQAELKGIYNSTGFRFLLRPLWNLLWPIKQTVKKLWRTPQKFSHKLINIKLWVNKISIRFFRRLSRLTKKSLEKTKLYTDSIFFEANRVLLRIGRTKRIIFFKRNNFSKAYLNHIYNNTFPAIPKKLTLMLTSLCNQKCKFCDIPQRNYRKKELSKNEAAKIINDAAKLGIEQLEITGGEPLLHKDLFEIMSHASSLGLKVTLSTNGTLIKKHMDQIIDSGIFCTTVSIDGFVDTYNYLRNYTGIYSEIIGSLEYLKQRNNGVAVSFVVTNKNIHELEELYNFFKERKIFFAFFPVVNKPDLYLRSDKDKKIFIDFVKKLKRKREISKVQYQYYMSMLKYYNNGVARVRCLGLYREFGVDVNGDLFPCCVWKNEDRPVAILGNLLRDDIEELWHSDEIHKARLKIFTEGCGGCYNPDICSFSYLTGMNFLLNDSTHLGNKVLPSKSAKQAKPSHVHMRLTLRCNLSCRHCDIWKNNNKNINKELNTEQWKNIVSKIYNWLGSFRLDLAGGEILLRKDALDIIRYCTEKNINVNLTTNAFLIDENLARQIVDSGLRSLTVSLDGFKPDTHNYIRNNQNAYRRAKNAIYYVNCYRDQKTPYICIAPVIMKQNLDELLDLVNLTKHNVGDSITFQALDQNFHAPYGPLWFKSNGFWPEEDRVNKVIDELVSLKLKGFKINNSFEQLNAMKQYYSNPLQFATIKCTVADKNFIVDESGRVLLCWNMAPVGNLLIDKAEDIWSNELPKERRKEIKNCTRTCRILNCNYL